MKSQVVFLALLGFCWVDVSYSQIECAEKCELSKCGPFDPTHCTAGTVKDECGCCPKCAQGEGEICDLLDFVDPRGTSGQCGDNLECLQRTDIPKDIKEGVCRCVMSGYVCGSDAVTYENFCQLRRVTPEITVDHRGHCQTKAKISNKLENVEVGVKDEVVLVCEVTGSPQPLVWWEFRGMNGEPYALPGTDARISVSARGGSLPYTITSWLQIQSADEIHEGDYSCIASNSRGDDSQTARIKVIRASEL